MGAGASAAAGAHGRTQASVSLASGDQALQPRAARSARPRAARRLLRDAGKEAALTGPAKPAMLGSALQAAIILASLCASGAAVLCCCTKGCQGRCVPSYLQCTAHRPALPVFVPTFTLHSMLAVAEP